MAAKVIAEVVKSALGPRGMDKMLVDSLGDVTITNDGATILKEMEVEHPAAKIMVEIAKTTDSEVGDGTTSAVVLAGELLKKAEELLDLDIHPTIIAEGYRMAATKAISILKEFAVKVDPKDRGLLKEDRSHLDGQQTGPGEQRLPVRHRDRGGTAGDKGTGRQAHSEN